MRPDPVHFPSISLSCNSIVATFMVSIDVERRLYPKPAKFTFSVFLSSSFFFLGLFLFFYPHETEPSVAAFTASENQSIGSILQALIYSYLSLYYLQKWCLYTRIDFINYVGMSLFL